MTYTVSDIEARWEANLEALESWHDEIIRTAPKRGQRSSRQNKDAIRGYWGVATKVLTDFNAYRFQTGRHIEPSPWNLFFQLSQVTESLGVGIIPYLAEMHDLGVG